MKNIQLVLIIAILILIYLISMQWLGKKSDLSQPIPVAHAPVVKPVVPTVNVAPETPPEVKEPTPEVKEETTIVSDTLTEKQTPEVSTAIDEEKVDPKLIEYRNTNYGYHLSLPKKMYYAGFGSRNGALHTLAIQADTLPETFGDATVRVFYYGKKILPELQNTHNNRYVDPEGKFILLLLNGEYSVKIESDNLQSPTVKTIEETIGID